MDKTQRKAPTTTSDYAVSTYQPHFIANAINYLIIIDFIGFIIFIAGHKALRILTGLIVPPKVLFRHETWLIRKDILPVQAHRVTSDRITTNIFVMNIALQS